MQNAVNADPFEELTRLAYARVVSINDATGIVMVELRPASASVSPITAACRLPQNGVRPVSGDLVEVQLRSGSDVPEAGSNRNASALLGSLERPIALTAFRRVCERKDNDQEFTGHLMRREGRGWLISIDGFEAFAKGEPPVGRDAAAPKSGDTTRIQVYRVARDRGSFVGRFSAQLRQEIRNSAFRGLAAGQIVSGRVKSIIAYGAFVEVETPGGKFDALLHNDEVSWSPNSRAADVVQQHEQREFQILKVEEDEEGNKRAWLSIKAMSPSPWTLYGNDLAEGDEAYGTVSNVTSYGIFVEVLPGLVGLIHRSKLIPPSPEGKVGERFTAGDRVWCRIANVDTVARQIRLVEIARQENSDAQVL